MQKTTAHSYTPTEVMTAFLQLMSRDGDGDVGDGVGFGDGDRATLPGTPVERPKSIQSLLSSWTSSPQVAVASSDESGNDRRKRPRMPQAADTAEQRADDDEERPTKRSREESKEE